MKYHGIAFLCGFILDLILGDPEGWPHPVRWIGKLIAVLDERFMGKQEKGVIQKKSDGNEKKSGGKDQAPFEFRRFVIFERFLFFSETAELGC